MPPRLHAALSEAAEVYFNAIQKIGEQALQSSTSQILGEARPFPITLLTSGAWGTRLTAHLLLLPRLCLLGASPQAEGLPCPHSRVPERVLLTAWLFQEVPPKAQGLQPKGPAPRLSFWNPCASSPLPAGVLQGRTGAARVPESCGKSLDFGPKPSLGRPFWWEAG